MSRKLSRHSTAAGGEYRSRRGSRRKLWLGEAQTGTHRGVTQFLKRTRVLKDGSKSEYWEAQVALGKRGNKKRFARKKLSDLKKVVATFLREKDEKDRGKRFLEASDETPKLTVEELVQLNFAQSTAGTTTTNRRMDAWRRRGGNLKDLPLHLLDAERLIDWAIALKKAKAVRDGQIAWEVLHMSCDMAVELGHLASNPLNLTQVRKLKPKKKRKADDGTGKQRILVYTQEEVVALIRASQDEQLQGLTQLIFESGLRLADALGLKWRDLAGNELNVRRQLIEEKGRLELTAEKTDASRRSIYIADATVNALGERFGANTHIFRNTRGGWVRKQAVYRMWTRVHGQAGVEKNDRSPHCARHTHATQLLAAGVPLAEVSRRLGHESVQTTMQFYAHWLPGDDRTSRAVELMAYQSS